MKNKAGDYKLIIGIICLIPVLLALFVLLLKIMGRGNDISLSRYIFIYLGAPIVNLDNYIASNEIIGNYSIILGQTFKPLYMYLAKILHVTAPNIPNINYFTFSATGVEIGNVYTTYYYFLYDLGFYGVVPLVAIMALAYTIIYSRVTKAKNSKWKIDYLLFVYAYIFNDLIMTPFSARFYETVLDAPFIKLIIFSIIFDIIFVEKIFAYDNKLYKITYDKIKRKISFNR